MERGQSVRHPRLIARCSSTADVVAAVRFARDHDLEIAVRGGGHNVAGTGPRRRDRHRPLDDACRVGGSASRKAQVQGGALWGETVIARNRPKASLLPGGIVGHTGVGGLTLGGRFGSRMRKYWSGCRQSSSRRCEPRPLGNIVLASAEEHPYPLLGAARWWW